jgi:hypothetical protein
MSPIKRMGRPKAVLEIGPTILRRKKYISDAQLTNVTPFAPSKLGRGG